MSFGWTAATWAMVAGQAVMAVGAVNSANAQKKANTNAVANAKATALASDEANNKANAKAPDAAAALSAAMLAGKQGNGSTMLTGPGGVDPSQLTLGKNSLLGG